MRVENIGGFTDTTVRFSLRVTILVGCNATNRTSFLQAVMAALGSDDVALKGDADEGTIELTLGKFKMLMDMRVLCENCGTQYQLIESLDPQTCECRQDPD